MKRIGLMILALSIFAVGSVLNAQRGDWPSTRAVKALETIFDAQGNLTTLDFRGTNPSLIYPDADSLVFRDFSSDHVVTFADVPDLTGSDSSEALVLNAFTPGILDAGDKLIGYHIDINGTANHTGGTVVALKLDNETNDAQSRDIGIQFDVGFDEDMVFVGSGVIELPTNGRLQFRDPTGNSNTSIWAAPAAGESRDLLLAIHSLTAMDSADDIVRGILLAFTSADHTNGFMYGSYMLNDVEDADAFEGAYYASAEWDAHMVMQSFDSSPSDDPPSGAVAFFVDDNADYSGGGGNDCALVARDAAGVNTLVVIIGTVNTACPTP